MKASLRLEAAQRPQWPRLYLLSRPRSRGRMPSLVGDGGQVLQVLGWALTIEYAIYRWCDTAKPRELYGGCVWNRAVSCLVT